MTPGSFDAETAREIIGDARARVIEAAARADADSEAFNFPNRHHAGQTYWDGVDAEMERVVYAAQHAKRIERIKRKAKA